MANRPTSAWRESSATLGRNGDSYEQSKRESQYSRMTAEATTPPSRDSGFDHDKEAGCPIPPSPAGSQFGHTTKHTLLPVPTDDPNDPLNWPTSKKMVMLSAMCLATFSGMAAATSPILATMQQLMQFQVGTTLLIGTIVGTIGGMIVGPFLFTPIAKFVGPVSTTFWSALATCGFSVWTALCNSPNDFVAYGVSRGIVGLFLTTPAIMTNTFIMNTFFLHQRGKVLGVFSTIYVLALIAGATFCGFVVQYQDWTVNFWWIAGVNGLAAIMVFIFMEETTYDRNCQGFPTDRPAQARAASWAKSRFLTFFPGNLAVPKTNIKEVAWTFWAQFLIGFSPVTIIAGVYGFVNFGFFIVLMIQVTLALSEPYMPAMGFFGYGFNTLQVGCFYFTFWVGILFAQIFGALTLDRIPLGISKRNAGHWAPEYRLHPIWFPGLVLIPLGLGIVGATLQYHWHWFVLCVGAFMITFGCVVAVPVTVGYINENFKKYPDEVAVVLNGYRLGFAPGLAFFTPGWIAKVGYNWCFGMMAFFSIFSFLGLVVLMWWGPFIRKTNLIKDDGEVEEHEGVF